MRRQSILLIATLGTLASLAACGSKEPPAPAADTAAQTAPETAGEPAAQPPVVTSTEPVVVAPPAASAPAPKPASKPASAPKPVASQPKPAPKPVVLTVPAGTVLAMSATTPLSSKTAKLGDPVAAQVTDAVTVDGKVAIPAGSTVSGQVTKIVSGSDKIGGKPIIIVSFDRLDLPNGKSLTVSGDVTQQGKSDTAGDTAKIVGGAAAGAIIGSQVKSGDKGKVIGGQLGAAAGTIAAKETGTEARIKEGAPLSMTLAADVSVPQ
jgi:hypothetical protein